MWLPNDVLRSRLLAAMRSVYEADSLTVGALGLLDDLLNAFEMLHLRGGGFPKLALLFELSEGSISAARGLRSVLSA